jgi:hypothetical protein
MSDLLPQLILLALGSAIAPPLLLLTILFLGSREPLSVLVLTRQCLHSENQVNLSLSDQEEVCYRTR